MRETTPNRFDLVRIGRLTGVLLGVLCIIPLLGETRIGVGATHVTQDIPPTPPYVSLVPDTLDFGSQVVRRTSAAKRITIKNYGGQPLYFESVAIRGDNPNSFAVLKDTCTGATIDPNKACIIDVTFTPSGTGGRNARLRLDNNAPDSPQRLRLKGNGINSSAVAPF